MKQIKKMVSGFATGTALIALSVGALCGYYGARNREVQDTITFLQEVFNNPMQCGAFAPSSPYVAQEVAKYIQPHGKVLHILEVGGGTGVITREIVQKLNKSNYVLDVVEIDSVFCKHLQEQFKDNKRVVVHHANIMQWQPNKQYDAVVSSIPFNAKIFTAQDVEEILLKYEQIIRPNGTLSYIELSIFGKVYELLVGEDEKAIIKQKRALLIDFKRKYLLEKETIVRNVWPMHVYHLKIQRCTPP